MEGEGQTEEGKEVGWRGRDCDRLKKGRGWRRRDCDRLKKEGGGGGTVAD